MVAVVHSLKAFHEDVIEWKKKSFEENRTITGFPYNFVLKGGWKVPAAFLQASLQLYMLIVTQ